MYAEPAIQLHEVVKTYQSGRRQIRALRGVSFSVERGEYVAIVGQSGCGKSTLLNLIAGLDTPDSGSLLVVGQPLTTLTQDELASWRGRSVGIVFQFFQLMPTLTARENVILPMDLAGNGQDRRARADGLLEEVGLSDLADHLPSELSGGEQQRVAIARALANQPALIVADEPTGNLDSANGERIIGIIESLWQAGTTIVLVTHDLSIARRAPRIVTMRDGQITADEARALPFTMPHSSRQLSKTNADAAS